MIFYVCVDIEMLELQVFCGNNRLVDLVMIKL